MTARHAIVPILLLALSGCYGDYATPEQTTADKAKPAPAAKTPAPAKKPPPTDKKPDEEKKPAQSYKQAWQLICDAERLAKVDPAGTRQQRGAQVARWIVKNVTNKKARYWFISYGQAKEDRETMFRAEFKRAGLKECALTSLLFPPTESKPATPTPATPTPAEPTPPTPATPAAPTQAPAN